MKYAPVFRIALTSDVIAALDFAESCHRGLQHETAATIGIDQDTYNRVAVCCKSAYEALCRARQLLDASGAE